MVSVAATGRAVMPTARDRASWASLLSDVAVLPIARVVRRGELGQLAFRLGPDVGDQRVHLLVRKRAKGSQDGVGVVDGEHKRKRLHGSVQLAPSRGRITRKPLRS